MALVTYYYAGSYSPWEWTDPINVLDGSETTFGYTDSNDAYIVFNDGTTCPGTDLGTITKVELRVLATGDGDDTLEFTHNSNMLPLTPAASKAWTTYIDITSWNTWTWSLLNAHSMEMLHSETAKGNQVDVYKVEIRVTYTPGTTYLTNAGGIASLEAFGTTTKINRFLEPTGIDSLEDFGATNLAYTQTLEPTGISSLEAFGTPIASGYNLLTPTGISSLEAFGTPTVTHILTVEPGFIDTPGPTVEIDVGSSAIVRSASWGANSTLVNQDNSANATGRIKKVAIYADVAMTGVKVGSFYGGNPKTCRDYTTIGAVTLGYGEYDVDFEIQTGDLIGWYCATGSIERDTTGENGLWSKVGDQFDAGSQAYSYSADDAMSVYGWLEVLAVKEPTVTAKNLLEPDGFETLGGVPVLIGDEAIDRPIGYAIGGRTLLTGIVATGAGIIDTVELFFEDAATGVKVGTFGSDGGNWYSVRDYAVLGNVASGSKQTFSGLKLACQAGDFIGITWATGTIERSTVGCTAIWYDATDNFGGGSFYYSDLEDDGISLQAKGFYALKFGTPVVSKVLIIGMNFIASEETLYQPGVSGGEQIDVQFIASTETLYQPSVAGPVSSNFISSTEVTYNPTVTPGNVNIAPAFISSTETLYQPTATPGNVNVSPAFIASSEVMYQPTTTTQNTIELQFISSVEALYQPTVTPGNVNTAPQFIASSETLYQPEIIGATKYLTNAGGIASAEAFGTPKALHVVTISVAASSDDCDVYYNSAWFFSLVTAYIMVGFNSTDTVMKQGGGMRFLSVAVPNGATIESAHLVFITSGGHPNSVCNSEISGEDVDDAVTFSTFTNYKNRRGIDGGTDNRTTAKVSWNDIPAWTFENEYTSPDVKTIIQEIIDRSGWASGQDLVIFWDDHDGNSDAHAERAAASYDHPTREAQKLVVKYLPPLKVEPTFIASAEVIYTPEVFENIEPVFIASTETLYQPTITTQNLVELNFISSTETIYQPEVYIEQFVDPQFIASDEVLYQPSITSIVDCNFITSEEALYHPTVTSMATVEMNFISSGEVLYQPEVLPGGVQVDPTFIISEETFYQSKVYEDKSIGMNFIPTEEAFYNPSLSLRTIEPIFITSSEALYQPGVAGPVNMNFISSGEVLYNPAAGAYVEPTYITSAETVYEPKLIYDQTVTAAFNDTDEALYQPTVTPGNVDVDPSFITSLETCYQPTVLPGGVQVDLQFIDTTEALYLPTALPGNVDVDPAFLTSGETFYLPAVTQLIECNFITSSETFHNPRVWLGQTVYPYFITSGEVMYEPAVGMVGYHRLVTFTFRSPRGIDFIYRSPRDIDLEYRTGRDIDFTFR